MPLVDVELSINGAVLPEAVAVFLREADSRVGQFVENYPVQITGFVPSDFATVYRGLQAIAEANLAAGSVFCEWGSGFGVVASLAAMLGFDVCGIEVEKQLVDASVTLANDFDLSVQFVHGSFVPDGGQGDVEEAFAEHSGDLLWLVTDADDAYDQLGLDADDFDVVFAYPWPGEDQLVAGLFEKYASVGALLLTYDQLNSLRLRRKAAARSRRRNAKW